MDMNTVYQFLIHLNPIILIIVGVVLFFASKLAKFIGILCVIAGIILLLLPYILPHL